MFKLSSLTVLYLFTINFQVVNNHENGDFYGLKIQDPIVFKCDLGFHDAINEGYGIANDALYKGTKSILFFKVNKLILNTRNENKQNPITFERKKRPDFKFYGIL